MPALRTFPRYFLAIVAACGASGSPGTAPLPTDPPTGASTAPIPDPPPAPGAIPLPPSGKKLGATPFDGGVEIRVWAPGATAVAVVGDVAGPSGRAAMTTEPGGYFAIVIAGAHAGQKYRFAITGPDGKENVRLDPRARAIDGAESVVVDPRTYAWKSGAFTPPLREQIVIYELHVGAFAVPSGTAAGTFTSAIDRLDTLADLGVSAIELMPVNLHGTHQGWGYNPQAWFAPHPDYGTPDDLRHLVDEAHARNIAVYLDVVFNHYDGGASAPLRCFDGACANGTAGVYFFDKGTYEKTPWGPRPDFAKKEVSDFFADNVFAWTTEDRIDGFRHDSVSNIRGIDGQGTVPGGADLLRRMNDVTETSRPGAIRIAEDLKGYSAITAPADKGGFAFDAQWDGGFGNTIVTAVAAASDDARNLGAVQSSILGSYNGDPMERVLYVETHDTAGNDGARLPARIDAADPASKSARKRAMLAAGVMLATPGVPMIFMGQEMLESTKFAPQPAALDWSKADTFAPVRTFYRDMIRLRRNLDGASPGLLGSHVAITHKNDASPNKVMALRRWNAGGDDVMVVMNFGAKTYARYDIGLPGDGAWKVRLDGDDVRYGVDFGAATPTPITVTALARDGMDFTGSIALGPYSIVVLSR